MESLTLRDVLKLAVTTEQIGAKLYARLARRFSIEGKIGEVFEQLARDEGGHETYFQSLLERTPTTAQAVRYDETSYLRAVTISRVFKQAGFDQIDDVQSPADALRKAVELERASLALYQALRDEIGASPALDELIATEKSHVVALMRVVVSDAKFRGIADAWA